MAKRARVGADRAFLEAILADPDDAVRLVFADWLDEHGQPERAEFIRVQVERARRSPRGNRAWELQQHEEQLLRGREEAWAGPLPGLAERWQFKRGFIEGVHIEGEKFLPRAGELFATFPLRSLQLIIV